LDRGVASQEQDNNCLFDAARCVYIVYSMIRWFRGDIVL
jgi:hypothetical protein